MSNTIVKNSKEDGDARPTKAIYFVPGIGHVEAADISDVADEVKKLKEKREDGDANI